ARFDQEIAVDTVIVTANPRFIEFGYEIRCVETERVLARGTTRHVWLNREMRPTRLPERYHAALIPETAPVLEDAADQVRT
ncbi:MAG: acyl-CoA thioesterase, partial [Candidatus Acidiferrales bacterium]